MTFDTTGYSNAAVGLDALQFNTNGYLNTATGESALLENTSGIENTAMGSRALLENTNGSYNTAVGTQALHGNSSGTFNTASGLSTLFSNTTGHHNTASGARALILNTAGSFNTAMGLNALVGNTTGNFNAALGYAAGQNLTTGSNNIDLVNAGAAGESNTIRIGVSGTHTATYIAGINGAVVTGSDVIISSSGRLGVMMSSARYKRDIRDMGAASSALMKLRPVTFRYKDDPAATLQYGLVAEEVAKIHPELATYGADGKLQTVRYSVLSAMLLNELQKQARKTEQQLQNNQRLARQVKQLSERMAAIEAGRARDLEATRAAFEQCLEILEQALAAKRAAAKVAYAR